MIFVPGLQKDKFAKPAPCAPTIILDLLNNEICSTKVNSSNLRILNPELTKNSIVSS